MNGPLATHGGCTSPVFARTQPQTYMAVLQMLVTHCTVHHHFLASSSLLTSSQHSGKFTANFVPKKRYIHICFCVMRILIFLFKHYKNVRKRKFCSSSITQKVRVKNLFVYIDIFREKLWHFMGQIANA